MAGVPGMEAAMGPEATDETSDVRAEIEGMLGRVPGFLARLPEDALEPEWRLMRRVQFSDAAGLSPKVRQLVGLAVASALRCEYTALLHSECARTFGAREEELSEVLAIAKHTTGLSAAFQGMRYDREAFRREVREIVEHLSPLQRH